MIGFLLAYTFKNLQNSDRTRIYRKLFGYDDESKYGQYQYKREGLLSKIIHSRPHESTIIFKRKEDCKQVMMYLKNLGAEIFSRQIILSEKDKQKLIN